MSVWKPITELQAFQSDVFKNVPTIATLIFLYNDTHNIPNDSTRTICALFTEAYHDVVHDNFVDTDIIRRYMIDNSCYDTYLSYFSGFKITDLTNQIVSFFNNSRVRFDAPSNLTCGFVLKPYSKLSEHFESIKLFYMSDYGSRLIMSKFNLNSSDYTFMSSDHSNERDINKYKILKLDPLYPVFKNKKFKNKNYWSNLSLSNIWSDIVPSKEDPTFIIYNHQFELVGNNYNSKLSSLKEGIGTRLLSAYRVSYRFNDPADGI